MNTIYGLDRSKYPTRMGKTWEKDETKRLLVSIENKKSIEDIATEHERTVGGINSYRKKIAGDYHFYHKLPIEAIQKYTGLTKEEIEDTIQKRIYLNSIKDKKKEAKHAVKSESVSVSSSSKEILEVKNDIKILKDDINILKKDVREMLRLMNALYEFENQS